MLRADRDEIIGTDPPRDTAAASRCHRAYNPERGFAAEPVPVVKTADRQAVLATVRWGYSAAHNLCYLVLDNQAITILRAAHNTPQPEPEPAVSIPAPADRAVLAEESVGAGGAVVSSGVVTVSVPAGAVDEAVVEVREALGEFVSLVGGEVVGVEHRGPVREPITVTWDVSHLSEHQQQTLFLVRWDEEVEDWVPLDDGPDLRIEGGTLTAEVKQWSWLSWVGDKITDGLQYGLEKIGKRAPAPECSGALPDWVSSVTDPDTLGSAAAVRVCYEPSPYGDTIRVKMTNNRLHGQVIEFTSGEMGDYSLTGLDPSLSELVRRAVFAELSSREDDKVYIPPLRTVVVDVPRPAGTGPFVVRYTNKLEFHALFADAIIFAMGIVDPSELFSNKYLDAAVEVLFDCGVQQLYRVNTTDGISSYARAVYGVVNDCIEELAKPHSNWGRELQKKLSSTLDNPSLATRAIKKAAKLIKKVSAVLKVIDVIFYLGDLALHKATGPITFQITGQKNSQPSDAFTALSIGPDLTCWIRTDGTAGCWGGNGGWQWNLPAGTFTDIAAGDDHSCAIRKDGTAQCWGSNYWGPDYVGQADAPAGQFTAIAAAYIYSCALTTTGTIRCWGGHISGESDAAAGRFTAISAGGGRLCALTAAGSIRCWGRNWAQSDAPTGRFTAIAAGGGHSCALTTAGAAQCWGNNNWGQLDAPAGRFTAIAVGRYHSCALTGGGIARCWGAYGRAHDKGQLDAPAGRFTAIAVGRYHSCALTGAGAAQCWGDNEDARYSCALTTARTAGAAQCRGDNEDAGDGGTAYAPAGTFTAISAGGLHSCALTTEGTAQCWGYNSHGEAYAPAGTFTAISASGIQSCVITTAGTIRCWGDNDHGQLDAPAGTFTAIAAGRHHWCALTTAGTIRCWGKNYSGQLDAPAGTFTAISAGDEQSCALTTAGAAQCWGRIFDGKNTYYGGLRSGPAGTFTAIAAGWDHACVLTTAGTIRCWGRNDHGQANAPVGTFTAIAAGRYHSCALTTEGAAQCWGNNESGQAYAPVGTFTAIAAGQFHSCALTTAGAAQCWGNNEYGQLDAPG